MNELIELPRGIPFLLFPVDNLSHALQIIKHIQASLYRSPIINALYLFVAFPLAPRCGRAPEGNNILDAQN